MDAIKEAMIAQDDGRSTRAQDEFLELVGGQVTVRAEQQAERQPESRDKQFLDFTASLFKRFPPGSTIDINALDPFDPVHCKDLNAEGTDERLERIEREQDFGQDGGAKFNG